LINPQILLFEAVGELDSISDDRGQIGVRETQTAFLHKLLVDVFCGLKNLYTTPHIAQSDVSRKHRGSHEAPLLHIDDSEGLWEYSNMFPGDPIATSEMLVLAVIQPPAHSVKVYCLINQPGMIE
jgi:hypothetical protein